MWRFDNFLVHHQKSNLFVFFHSLLLLYKLYNFQNHHYHVLPRFVSYIELPMTIQKSLYIRLLSWIPNNHNKYNRFV